MKKIFVFVFGLAMTLGFAQDANAQTMTCTLVEGSITYFPDMVCALYSCPNGETVQSCNMRGVIIK